jgi:hypothetical protein
LGIVQTVNAEQITAGLRGKWNAVKSTGKAKCPAHDDREPSLSVSDENGFPLVKCHAGCSQEAVVGALREMGLWTTPPTWEMPSNGVARGLNGTAQRAIAATYDYCDEQGTVVFQTVRFEPKTFRQRRPDGHGGWSWSLDGVRLVLYRLPELLAAGRGEPVYITEGEKDADRAPWAPRSGAPSMPIGSAADTSSCCPTTTR